MDPLVDVRTLANELGCSPRTILNAIRRGDLLAARPGRHYLIHRVDVRTWLRSSARIRHRPHTQLHLPE